MNKFLLLWLTAMIPLITVGQKFPATVEIDLSNYVTQDKINNLEKRIQALEAGGGTKPVEPVKEKCKEGPVPVAITKITSTSANITWHGKDVKDLTWRIVGNPDTTNVYAYGNHIPSGNQFPITYAGIPAGQYRLQLIGNDCDGIGGRNFSIAGLPPPVTIQPCEEGPRITEVKNIMPSGVTVIFHGKDVRKLVVDTRQGGKLIQSDTLSPSSSELTIRYKEGLTPGTYLLKIAGISCTGGGFESTPFVVSNSAGGGGVIVDPVPDGKEYVINGAYRRKVSGRTFGYNKTPEFAISFNSDGSITDVTHGLKDGKLGDKTVFYAIDHFPMEAEGGGFAPLQNIKLDDGNYTLQQYICDAGKIPDFATFKAGFAGWGERGINSDNARRNQIFLSIHSDNKVGNGTSPDWLHVSRVLNYTKHAVKKDWRPYYKFNGIGARNINDNVSIYHNAGIATQFGNGDTGPALWRTNRMPSYYQPTNAELYSWGRGEVDLLGGTINVSTTSEFVENTYGKDTTNLPTRLWNYYKGFNDRMMDISGSSDTRMFGAFGDYGGDDWHGVFGAGLTNGYENFKRSLTDMLYGSFNPIELTWPSNNVIYYQYGEINYRNLNKKVYFDNSVRYVPYEFMYLNERVKLATKTYEGKDRERNIILFTSPKVESFVFRPDGSRNNIEITDGGEIIPFPNGELLTRVNHQPPVPWGEMYESSLWAHLLGGGVMNWDAPGSTFGQDSTLFDAWEGFEHAFSWKKNGEKDFQSYSPGQNGAPGKSNKGYINRLYALPLDAHMAAADVAWKYRDKTTKLSHVAYESTRGGYVPQPGVKGLHLNGFGEINKEQYNPYHIYNQKKAIALLGEGPAGRVLIYYNGFLSGHLHETVTIMGKTFKAQGRQTVIIEL